MKSVPAISFDYVPSRRVAIATLVMAVMALIAVAMCALPLWLRMIIGSGVVCVAWVAILRQQRSPFRHIGYGAGGWRLLDIDDTEHPVCLRHHAVLGPLLTLDFSPDDGSRGVGKHFRPVFAGDNLDPETRRRLVLLLSRAEVLQHR